DSLRRFLHRRKRTNDAAARAPKHRLDLQGDERLILDDQDRAAFETHRLPPCATVESLQAVETMLSSTGIDNTACRPSAPYSNVAVPRNVISTSRSMRFKPNPFLLGLLTAGPSISRHATTSLRLSPSVSSHVTATRPLELESAPYFKALV